MLSALLLQLPCVCSSTASLSVILFRRKRLAGFVSLCGKVGCVERGKNRNREGERGIRLE